MIYIILYDIFDFYDNILEPAPFLRGHSKYRERSVHISYLYDIYFMIYNYIYNII